MKNLNVYNIRYLLIATVWAEKWKNDDNENRAVPILLNTNESLCPISYLFSEFIAITRITQRTLASSFLFYFSFFSYFSRERHKLPFFISHIEYLTKQVKLFRFIPIVRLIYSSCSSFFLFFFNFLIFYYWKSAVALNKIVSENDHRTTYSWPRPCTLKTSLTINFVVKVDREYYNIK